MTTVRPKMKEMVKSFYTFLLICLGYPVFASQLSETNFNKLSFVCITHIWHSFDNSSLDSYKIACLLQTGAFSAQKDK